MDIYEFVAATVVAGGVLYLILCAIFSANDDVRPY